MPNLIHLPTFDRDGALRVVIETPAGSRIKFKYDPGEEVFLFGRPLVLGVSYPFDWGFIPSTRAEDGDPLDAMVYHDGAAYPGVVIACQPIGVVRVSQKRKGGGRERNDRVIAVPAKDDRCNDARDLNERTRIELEQFFLAAVFLEGKGVQIKGWSGPSAAKSLISAAQATYNKGN
ncbi:MAG TPA: inorganic diphosphatase [Candidatus Binatia bacterium]|nr:inorganic diphosphatase [Candidatus Binatia bacterium]